MDNNKAFESLTSQIDEQTNPYADLVKRQNMVKSGLIKANISQAVKVSPDRAAKVKSLARDLNLPVEVVQKNETAAEQQRSFGSVKYKDIISDTPGLAKWLEEPSNASVAHDDTDNLYSIEKNLQGMANLPHAFVKSLGGEYNKLSASASLVMSSIPVAYDKLSSEVSGIRSTQAQDWWYSEITEPLLKKQRYFDPNPNASMVEKGGEIAGSLAGLMSMIMLSGGSGEAVLPVEAGAGRVISGALETGTKTMAVPSLSNAVNTANDVYEKTGSLRQAVSAGVGEYESMTAMGFIPLSAPGNIAQRMAGGGASGLMLDELAREHMNTILPESMRREFSVEDALFSVLVGSILAGTMGPRSEPNHHKEIRKTYEQTVKAEKAQKDYASLDALRTLMSESKVNARDPESVDRFLQSANKSGPKDIYVSLKTLMEVLETMGKDERRTLSKTYPNLEKNIKEAELHGSDVKIALKDFLTKLANKSIGESLLPHLKTTPDGMSLAESDSFYDGVNRSILEQAQKVVEMNKAEKEWQDSYDKVEQTIAEQLSARWTKDVSKAYAKLTANFYSVQAKRLGMKPAELYEKIPLKISTEKVGDERSSFTPDDLTIHQPPDADLTSYLHELGHFFLKTTTDLSVMPDAPVEFKQDIDTVMKWFGTDITKWNKMSADQQRPFHEKYAEGFESYLFENKAPNLEMRGIFRRFRSWLVSFYQGADVKITDDVRGVFDRLLATREAIDTLNDTNNYKPMFESKPDSMSEDQWQSYKKNDAVEKAVESLNARSLANMKWFANAKSRKIKELQRVAKAKRSALMDEVMEEVLSQPLYQAREFLHKGTLDDTPRNNEQRRLLELTGMEGEKLSLDALKAMYGKEPNAIWRYLPKTLTTAKGGTDPDAIATIFGIESGDKLVRGLIEAPATKDIVRQLTDQRMLERYGDLTDPVALERGAEAAIHNNMRVKVIAAEYAALNKAIGSKTELIKAAERYADDYFTTQTVGDLNHKRFTAAESKASRDAEAAFKKGKTEEAAEYKRAQLLNNILAKKALEIRDEIDKKTLKIKKLDSNKSTRDKLRGEFKDQLDEFLARFDFRKTVPKKDKESLKDWIEKTVEENLAINPQIDGIWLDASFKKHYKDLTVEEFRGLFDTVEQLRNLARREHDMYKAIRQQTFEQERDGIINEMAEINPESFKDGEPKGYEKPYIKDMEDRIKRGKAEFDIKYLNLEFMTQVLSKGKFGQLHESIVQRLSNASDYKLKKFTELGTHIKPYLDAYTVFEKAAFSRKPIHIKSANTSITREQMLIAAMHYGNPEGRQRLRDGHGWNDVVMKEITSHITTKDLNLMNALWKMMDDMVWPELEAVNKRTTGSAPPKVDSAGFDTPAGKAKGGYWPLVYDGEINYKQQSFDEAQATKDLLGGSTYGARTAQSASKERLQTVNKALTLDFTGVNYKLNETVHDIAYREAIADVYRLLSSETVRKAIDGVGGPGYSQEMRAKIRQVAGEARGPQNGMENLITTLRRNAISNIMGLSVKTALLNVTGIVPAMSRVSPVALGKAIGYVAGNWKTAKQDMLNRSAYMPNRVGVFERTLTEAAQNLMVKNKFTPEMSTMLAMIGAMDSMVSTITWHAAYGEALNGKIKEINIGDKAKASDYADHIVRQTQGSGRDVDVAKIQTGPYGKAFVFFYSYYNAMLGLLRRSGHINISKDPMKIAKLAADFGSIVVLPTILSALLYGRIDEEKPLKSMAVETMFYSLGMFPIFGPVAMASYNILDPDQPFYGYRGTPIQGALSEFANVPKAAVDIASGEGDKGDVRSLMMGTGYATGLPMLQIWRTFNHLENTYGTDQEINPWYLFMGEPPK